MAKNPASVVKYERVGDLAWSKIDKINAELFTLTYGSMVVQLTKDLDDVQAVNDQMERMGYNIGIRLIDEFLAKSSINHRCADFSVTGEVVAKVGMKMFLGITATSVKGDKDVFSLLFDENPLNDFVELPDGLGELWYSNVIAGIIRGALEMVQMKVEAKYVRDQLRGDETNEIKVTLIEVLHDEIPVGEDDEE